MTTSPIAASTISAATLTPQIQKAAVPQVLSAKTQIAGAVLNDGDGDDAGGSAVKALDAGQDASKGVNIKA